VLRRASALLRRFVPESLLRCAASSLVAIAVEFVIMTTLVSGLRMHYLVGWLFATTAYLALNFVLNRRWAFRDGAERGVGGQLARHLGMAAVGMTQGTSLMWLFVHVVRLPYQAGWAAAGCIGFSTWTWPMSRRTFGSAPS
jgi:putative flippase GtrA